MFNYFLIILGKLLSLFAKLFNLGSGSTWPGHIALNANKHFIKDLLKNSKIQIILIAGTNGKTTTSKLIQTVLSENGQKVLQNETGANLLNGIASTFLLHTNIFGKLDHDFAIFEVDENTLPQILKETTPEYVVLLNLFRDQLDRYGEVNSIVNNWKMTLAKLPEMTTLILNADDPQIAYLGLTHSVISNEVRDLENKKEISRKARNDNILYFGLQKSQFGNATLQHAADSVYCPKCGEKLHFEKIAFSHLGDWACKKCGLKKPDVQSVGFAVYPLPGLYNKYNVDAATILLKKIGLTDDQIHDAFTDFVPAFGRQEIITYKNKHVQIFLSKNPTSFNESYTTIKDLDGKTLLLVLNDRIPDGRDVSWIWDVDLPELEKFKQILISGDRVYDMALRIKYEGYKNYHTFENLPDAIEKGISLVDNNETLFVLPTYSAMLDVRKIITGKKIL
jgi:lipid II isoglutaminyl synthase (glutamine-hydrolysing)